MLRDSDSDDETDLYELRDSDAYKFHIHRERYTTFISSIVFFGKQIFDCMIIT